MAKTQEDPKPNATPGDMPTLGADDLMPWETGSPGRKSDTLQALEDLIVEEEPELGDSQDDDDDEPATPVKRKAKAKKPAPSDEEDDEEVDDEDDEEVDDSDEEEDEDEEEAPGDDEAGDEEEFDIPEDAIVAVVIDGKEERVTIAEALDGYQRQSDYTRKTQAVAEDRKKYREEVEGTLQVREALGQQLALLEQALADDGTPPDHWATLRTENPEQFANEYAAFEARNQKLKQVRAFITQQQEDAAGEMQKAHNTRLIDERNKLTEAVPEWTDEKVFDEALGKIQTYLVDTYGASEKELGQIYDHRFILMARDAMLYRRAKSKGKDTLKRARKKGGARILKPGASKPTAKSPRGKSKRRVKAFSRARTRLARSGNVGDAAAALLALEDD